MKLRKHKHRHRRRHLPWKKVLLPLLCILFLSALLVFGLYQEHQRVLQLTTQAEQAGETAHRVTMQWNGRTYALREDLTIVALIGIDEEAESDRAGQCDFVTLLVADEKAQQWKLLQINRDTMCNVPRISEEGRYMGIGTEQLALAHAYGSGKADSCRNTLRAVENLLYGISIHDYIRISIGSVPVLNDAVGGVTVTLRDDFSKFDEEMVKGTTLTLTGPQAELFVRARRGMEDPSNLNRMERQRTYLHSWLDAAQLYTRSEDEEQVSIMLYSVAGQLFTNLNVHSISQLAGIVSEYPSPEILTVAGEAVQGDPYIEYHVDESALQQQVVDLFYEPVKE